MKIAEYKQRSWVRKHRRNLPQLHAQVLRRVLIMRDKLWFGDPKPFSYLLLGVLGRMTPQNALGNAVIACWELGQYKTCLLNYLNLLLAVSALSYFNRRQKGKPRVLVYAPLNSVPTGEMHLLDFTPAELGRQLGAAMAAHGTGQEYSVARLWVQGSKFPPGKAGEMSVEHYYSEVRKNGFLASVRSMQLSGRITAEQARRFESISERWFTPDVEVAVTEIARSYRRFRMLSIPGSDQIDEVRLESLRAGLKLDSSEGANALAHSLLKFGRGDSSAVTLNALQVFFPDELPLTQGKGDADMVYNAVVKAVARRAHVQAVCSRVRNQNAAFDECQLKYPNLTLNQFIEDSGGGQSHIEPALEEAAAQLDRGPEFARKLYKRASANFGVNKIWGDYLEKFSSFPVPKLR